jgi:pilus assembly protein CpaF
MSKNDLNKALGPLAGLFEDPDINVVMVDGPQRVTIEKYGGIEETGISFQSDEEVKNVIQSILKSMGVEMEENKTIYDIRLTDNSRMLAVLTPTALTGNSLIIRKWMTNRITWEKLFEYNSVSPEVRDLIQSAVRAHVSMLVAGGIASGKTTFTNRIVELIPPEERIVAVEQTHEFQFKHPQAVFLEADDAMRVKMNELMVTGSMMRPDWLIIGEMNGAEAMRAMQIFANGHKGMTTIHATSAENALTRLETMCLMANLGLGLNDIREMIASALQLVLYQECLAPNGNRKLTQISELRGLENGRYILQPLMRFNVEKDVFEMTGAKPTWEK